MANRLHAAALIAAAAALPAPPAKEAVRPVVVPTPTLTHVQFPSWTHDGARLLVSARGPGIVGTQIVTMRPDGADVRCLTCTTWTGAELSKPWAFGDGRRVLLRVGRQTPVRPADHAILECTPSVAQCDAAAVVPVEAPSGTERAVVQDQRELRVAPDDAHVGFTQVRESAGGQSEGLGVVGTLRRLPDRYAIDDPRVVSRRGELKGFAPDGQSVLIAEYNGPFEAANPDNTRIDLRTGRRTRVTTDPDWEEDIDVAARPFRGRRWMVVGSARTADLLEPVSQLRRPPYIEPGIRALPYTLFATDQAKIAEPWLVDEHDSRAGYRGQPLYRSDGWDSRTNFTFSPLGNAVTFWQLRGTATRIVVTHLDDRPAQAPPAARTTPTPRWARSLKGARVPEPEVGAPRFTRRGKAGGRVTVIRRRSKVRGYRFFLEVRYERFADTRGYVLDGFERSDFQRGKAYGGTARYTADVRLSGMRTGFLRAKGVRLGDGQVRGTIRSRVGDRALTLEPRVR